MRNLLSSLKPLRAAFRKGAPKTRAPRKKDRRAFLSVETLEDRAVPTVVFAPKFGGETLNPTGTSIPIYTTLNNPTVNLIFWASTNASTGKNYWTNTAGPGPAQAAALTKDFKTLLNSSYLSAVQPYDPNWKPNLGGVWIDPSGTVPSGFTSGDLANGNPKDPTGQASFNAIQAEIQRAITTPGSGMTVPGSTSLANAPIYVVVTDPADAGGNGGYNTNGSYSVPGSPLKLPINIASVGTAAGNLIDNATSGLSHELAERISDPAGGGVTLTLPSTFPKSLQTNVGNQIGDGETAVQNQVHYNYRLGGSSGFNVQPVWYSSTGFPGTTATLVVQDGNSQTLTLTPVWNSTGGKNPTYSFGDASGNPHYTLTIDGDQRGSNTADAITIDSTDANGLTVTLNGETFYFDAGTIDSITVEPGKGNNSINVPELASNQTLEIDSSGSDVITVGNGQMSTINSAVTVDASSSASVNLTVDDSLDKSNPSATVTLGSATDQVTGLGSKITFSASNVDLTVKIGQGSLTVDDSASSTARSINVTNKAVEVGDTSFAAVPITVTYSGHLTALKVGGGSGNDTFQVDSTAAGTTTTLAPGIGTNSVFIGAKGLSNQAYNDYTAGWTALQREFNLITRHSLANIAGPVNVQANASGKTSLTVDDSGEAARSVKVTDSAVTFSGVPTISYSGIDALNLVAGTENPWVDVVSVPASVPVTLYNDASSKVWGPAASKVKVVSGLPSWDNNTLLPYLAFEPPIIEFNLPTPDPYLKYEFAPTVEQSVLGALEGSQHLVSTSTLLDGVAQSALLR
jgi:hypothetical protein